MSKKELQTEIDSSEAKFKEYIDSLTEFEGLFDNSTGHLRNAGGKITLPEYIKVVQEHGTEATVSLGNFWPKEVFERNGGVWSKSIEGFYTMNGKRIRGVYRDPCHGAPMGVIQITKKQVHKVQRTQQLENSDTAIRGKKQLDETWKIAVGAQDVSVKKKSKKEDGTEERLILSSKKKNEKLANSDSECDWQDNVLPKAFGTAQPANSSTEEEGEDDSSERYTRRKGNKATGWRKKKIGKFTKKLQGSGNKRAEGKKPKPKQLQGTKAVATKVYPSIQMRQIISAEQLVGEVQNFLLAASNEEGLKTIQQAKINAFASKINAKIAPKCNYVLTAANFLKEGDTMVDLKDRGNEAIQNLMTLKDKLAALGTLVTSLNCEKEFAVEATPAYLARARDDVRNHGVRLPNTILSEVVKRSCLALLNENNITSAISVLDPNLSLACGIAVVKDPDQQKPVQVDVAVAALCARLSKDAAAPSSDLEALIYGLPNTVKDTQIAAACEHIGCLLCPSKHTDDEVLRSLDAVQNSNVVGELLAKKMSASPRGRSLAISARTYVTQRSLDQGINKEFESIAASVKLAKKVPTDEHTEDAMVAVRFAAQELGRLNVNFLGLLSKCSAEWTAKHATEVEACRGEIAARARSLRHVVASAYWSGMQQPLRLVGRLYSGSELAGGEYAQAVEATKSRVLSLCLAAPKDIGFDSILGSDDFAELREQHAQMVALKDIVTNVIAAWELEDAHTTGALDIYSTNAMDLWTQADLFPLTVAPSKIIAGFVNHFPGSPTRTARAKRRGCGQWGQVAGD